MNREEIIDEIKKYVSDEKATYAVLINGGWGTGKTYLYKNHLTKAINEVKFRKSGRKNNIYISLYGISSIEALSKQVLSAYLLTSKTQIDKDRKALKTLQGVIGIASKAISFSAGPFSLDLDKVKSGIEEMIQIENVVICFDDLERCTIPMNEVFGFFNNLVEHCNCKVIVLADEANMGKVFANTNPEEKYLSILSGRRIIEQRPKDQSGRYVKDDSVVTVSELKKLNEVLYSENYIYKDIKEKVIGKTFLYYPQIGVVLKELIEDSYIDESNSYRAFLQGNINKIVSMFQSANNRNIRVMNAWIPLFEKIYCSVERLFGKSKYKNDVLDDFLQYSIWVLCAERNNKKINRYGNSSYQDYVYFEDNEYNHIIRFSFIDEWIKKHVWDDANLGKAVRSIEDRREQENMFEPKRNMSMGKALSKLYNWRTYHDDEVHQTIELLFKELVDGKYEYNDFSKIIALLLFLGEVGLYKGNIEDAQGMMLSLIDNYSESRVDDEIPKSFETEEITKRYNEIYNPIRRKMEQKNKLLTKNEAEEKNIYASGETFKDYCEKRVDYFIEHKSLFDYIEIESLKALIRRDNHNNLYDIKKGLRKVYCMGNVSEFFMADVDGLSELHDLFVEELSKPKIEITRKVALEDIDKFVYGILRRLGVQYENASNDCE